MKRQHNTALIALLGTILLGLSTYVLITIVELQIHIGMLSEEIMNVDKQIGRIYNFIDSVRSD
ncbi:hypothetical protein Greip_gp46 [Pelagibacter phage Greip EXVC021P]|jgi:hypothetical protein|nr:hypothetical protein Greip_gp46 [Pelagibacter phage Greip EXVC021P]